MEEVNLFGSGHRSVMTYSEFWVDQMVWYSNRTSAIVKLPWAVKEHFTAHTERSCVISFEQWKP